MLALVDATLSPSLHVQEMAAVTRRVAEVHYKIGLALQFLEEPAKALHHTQVLCPGASARPSILSAPHAG